MKTATQKPTDNGLPPSPAEPAGLEQQRMQLLAQIGEYYLAAEMHQATAQQALQRVAQLRASLAELEQSRARLEPG